MELENRQEEIKKIFSKFTSNDDKWTYILNLAKNNIQTELNDLSDTYIIQGCSSKIYLIPEYKDNKLYFKAYSESEGLLSLGLCIFACNLYSGLSCDEILNADLNFFETIGFYNGLTATRNNGFASVLNKIKKYAEVFKNLFTFV